MSDENKDSIDNIITINPDIDLNAQCFKKNEFIHAVELDRVLNIICNLRESSKGYDPLSKDPLKKFRRLHNTITLSGNRGSGKTSFLMSLKDDDTIKNEVFFTIDPTLTEEKGHIFLNIVSRIREEINKKCDGSEYLADEQYQIWNKYLKKLAAGMPLLDGVGPNLDASDWYDSTFVMEKGLHNVESSNNLELNFHMFIKKSLDILEKELLFIAFDDVDTDFAKGWPVMETIRKYLTSPQLIIILSGDIDLYSLLVRKKQWKNFGKTLLKNEYDKNIVGFSEEYNNLVSRLENQYLIKVLKPENRIVLSPLLTKIDLGVKLFKVLTSDGNIVDVKTYYMNILHSLGISSYIAIDTYYPLLASMSIRSQMSLMKAFEKYGDNGLAEDFVRNISDVFYTNLKSSKVEVWDLVNNVGFINVHVLKFLLENDILDEGSQLLPKTENDSLNGALIALGILWRNRVIKRPSEIFDYIIRISNIVNLAEKWGYKSELGTNLKDFISHSKVYYDYGLKKISSLQGAYIDAFLENIDDASAFGLIPLKMLYSINKKRNPSDTLRLDDIFRFNNKQSVLDYLGYLPSFNVTGTFERNQIYYSFNSILATVGELMQVDDENIINEFIKLSQFREYQRWQKGVSLAIRGKRGNEEGGSTPIDSEGATLNSEILGLDAFIQSFIIWKNEYKYIDIPPYMLGRIMVRTFYSFLRIDAKEEAILLHRQLICFLNAILVEEYMERNAAAGLNLANPTRKDEIFINNLKFALSQSKDLSLFNMIIKCPLINVFVDLSILNGIPNYEALFNKDINVNVKLRELSSFVNNVEGSSLVGNDRFSDIVLLDNISTERVLDIFWETPENAKKIAKYAMLRNFSKQHFVNNKSLIKQAIKQLFSNSRVYDKRVESLRRILLDTHYTLENKEWI